jgi:cytochrome c oxidase assembly protein subunit 15
MKNFRKFSFFTLGYTLLVILWGAYVRATGSGAGCGEHWPLCNGQVLPDTETMKTFIEFTHRTSSGINLVLVVIGYFWSRKIAPKGTWIRKSAFLSLIAIFLEALLGAGLVLLKHVEHDQSVGRAISISLHLVNTMFLISTLTSLVWFNHHPEKGLSPSGRWIPQNAFFKVCLAVFLLLGMSGAITALGDTLFPATTLAAGLQQDLAHDSHFLVKLRVFHPIIALIWVMMIFVWSKRFEKIETAGIRALLILAITTQFILGILNWILMAPNWMQLVHLLVADLVFITFWISGIIDQDSKDQSVAGVLNEA